MFNTAACFNIFLSDISIVTSACFIVYIVYLFPSFSFHLYVTSLESNI